MNDTIEKLSSPKVVRCKSCGTLRRSDNRNRLHLPPRLVHVLVSAVKNSGVVTAEHYDLRQLGMAETKRAHSAEQVKELVSKQRGFLKQAIEALRKGYTKAASEAIRKADSISYDIRREKTVLTKFGTEVAKQIVKDAITRN